jgi:FG-GAP-like repeat
MSGDRGGGERSEAPINRYRSLFKATGAVGPANQGSSVALSADGNTAIVGGPNDNFPGGDWAKGAAWVFTRSGGVWTQQGSKLVGTGAVGAAGQGRSVALSGDGNTAIVGGSGDNSGIGAAWVFTRSGGTWTQQGAKLVGSGATGAAGQGLSVAVSADGNTAIVGGFGDNSAIGAAWVFTRSGGAWTQQGSKLVGSGAVKSAEQGTSVALSGDGNTAIVGGPIDNYPTGATWVFTRSGGVWTQQGSKLVGTGAVGGAKQGISVALSGDGNTAIEGGYNDNSGIGAAWVFTRANLTNTHDFNDDGISDILWRDTSGDVALWLMNGNAILNSGGLGPVANTYSIIGQRDFTGGGDADLLWRDTGGDLAMWFMNGLTVTSTAGLGNVPTNWTVYGTADLNGDGSGDLLWRDGTTGTVAVWFMHGSQVSSTASFGAVPSTWTILDDVRGGLIWRDTNFDYALWLVQADQVTGSCGLGNVPSNWQFQGVGDFNGDGTTDILWRDSTSGTVAIWFLGSGCTVQSTASFGAVPSTWTIAQTGDYDGDGKTDILWQDNTGNVAIWFMNGVTIASTAGLGNVGTSWSVQALNAE